MSTESFTTQVQTTSHAIRDVLRWLKLSESALGNASDRLNAINIFPVADGDTGSNMYATISASRVALMAHVESLSDDQQATMTVGDCLGVAGRAALDHAHGNSGTLIAVIINAMAPPLDGATRLSAPLFLAGLQRARTAAWAALSDPQEGTMLSVLEAATQAAQTGLQELNYAEEDRRHSRKTLEVVVNSVVEAAWRSAVETEHQLHELTEAHVVDAGGMGLLLVLDALRASVRGQRLDPDILDSLNGFHPQYPHVHQDMDVEEGFEVMCSLELTPLDAATLRFGLDEIGDSVIMSPMTMSEDQAGTVRWRLHVHVPESEQALDLIRRVGEPENLTITALHEIDDEHCHTHDDHQH